MSILMSDLVKRYGDTVVVNRVSLEVEEGELFVLLGSSGSGKSTVLRIIAGLTSLDSGRVVLNGNDVTHLSPQARGVGFVFQNYSIFRHMTVSENIEFGLRIRKAPNQDRRRRSEELLDMVGLVGLGARYPDQLSGGQRQRVALARALAYEPAVLLLDEPFGALDVKIRVQLRESLKEVQRRLKVTTVLVTHDQEEAFELGNRIGVMERGRLIEVGRPEELYHCPKSEYAATFIGGGNVLVGRYVGGKIRLGAASLPLPLNAPSHDEGAPVRVLFRPETVVLKTKPFEPDSGITQLASGRVIERIFAGSQQRIRLDVEGLQGVRPIVPPPVYGRPITQIEVLQTSDAGLDIPLEEPELWIGLKNYHVLAPTGLKILICKDTGKDTSSTLDAVAATGSQLASAAGGPTTLLSVVKDNLLLAEAREALDLLARKGFQDNPLLERRIRQGQPAEEILQEAQEGSYELIILGKHGNFESISPSQVGATARQVLAQAEVPVLLVSGARKDICRLLICTAGGEPGKSDVLFGSRVSRQIGAQAVVFHILDPKAGPIRRRRAEIHLSHSKAVLESQGVESQLKLAVNASPVEGILQEAEVGDYDLIIIGRPAPRHSQQFVWSELAGQIVTRSTRPVLVVPMKEIQ